MCPAGTLTVLPLTGWKRCVSATGTTASTVHSSSMAAAKSPCRVVGALVNMVQGRALAPPPGTRGASPRHQGTGSGRQPCPAALPCSRPGMCRCRWVPLQMRHCPGVGRCRAAQPRPPLAQAGRGRALRTRTSGRCMAKGGEEQSAACDAIRHELCRSPVQLNVQLVLPDCPGQQERRSRAAQQHRRCRAQHVL